MEVISNQGIVIYSLSKKRWIMLICDLHLGAFASRPVEIHKAILEKFKIYPDLLVMIVGDLYDKQNSTFDVDELKLMDFFWELAKNGQLIIIRGDHDSWLQSDTKESFNLPVHDYYLWRAGRKVHCAIHGHQCDSFNDNNKHLSKILLGLYYFFQKLANLEIKLFKTQSICQGIDWAKGVKGWWRSWSKQSAGGIINYVFSWGAGVAYVYGGHLHKAIKLRRRIRPAGKLKKKRVRYINIGGCPDLPFRYLMLKGNKFKVEKVDLADKKE